MIVLLQCVLNLWGLKSNVLKRKLAILTVAKLDYSVQSVAL